MRKIAFLIFILIRISVHNLQAQDTSVLTDINGNVYQTIVIGPYLWMSENLKTSKYNDGTEIPNIAESSIWVDLKTGAFCFYDNSDSNNNYGALYNWYAVNTGKLCPEGWRVPNDEEWKYLEGFVDSKYDIGDTVWNNKRNRGYDAGLQLKADFGWNREGNGPNTFGFSALPGGERCSKGRSFQEGNSGFWWSSSEIDSLRAWYRNIFYDYERIYRDTHPKYFGFSVRCISNK